jgi:hypothetical protein
MRVSRVAAVRLILTLFSNDLNVSDDEAGEIVDFMVDLGARKVIQQGTRVDMQYYLLDTLNQLRDGKSNFYVHPMLKDEAINIFGSIIHLTAEKLQNRYFEYFAPIEHTEARENINLKRLKMDEIEGINNNNESNKSKKNNSSNNNNDIILSNSDSISHLRATEPETVYEKALRLLKPCNHLIGRENEKQDLYAFVRNCFSKKSGGICYISGPSGVGKSLTVQTVMTCISTEGRTSLAVDLASQNFPSLLEYLREQLGAMDRDALIQKLSCSMPIVLVVDEVDQYRHRNDVITLFEIANRSTSQLVLIGIGNNRNFMHEIQFPEHLPIIFPAYGVDDLIQIFSTKLSEVQLFGPGTIKMLAYKGTDVLGDIRVLTSCLTKAIKSAESENLTKPQGSDIVKVC